MLVRAAGSAAHLKGPLRAEVLAGGHVAEPGWSNAVEMATWAASASKARAYRWDLRRCASPPDSTEQSQASSCSLMGLCGGQLLWPAIIMCEHAAERVRARVGRDAADAEARGVARRLAQ